MLAKRQSQKKKIDMKKLFQGTINLIQNQTQMLEKLEKDTANAQNCRKTEIAHKLESQITNFLDNLEKHELMDIDDDVRSLHPGKNMALTVIEEAESPDCVQSGDQSFDDKMREIGLNLNKVEQEEKKRSDSFVSPRNQVLPQVSHRRLTHVNQSMTATPNRPSLMDMSFNSSFFQRSNDSQKSFLKNELQSVINKNLSDNSFMKQLITVTKEFQKKIHED